MNGLKNGWMNGRIKGCKDEWMEWMNEQKDKCTKGWMNKWITNWIS